MFEKMLWEEYRSDYNDTEFRRENPMFNDLGVAEHMHSRRFEGNMDRLGRSRWRRFWDSRPVSFVLFVLAFGAAGAPGGLVMGTNPESFAWWQVVIMFVSLSGAFVAGIATGIHRENHAARRRTVQMSATGVSLYRRALHWASRFEKHTNDPGLLSEVVRLVTGFQEVAVRERTVQFAQRQLLAEEGKDFMSQSAVKRCRTSKGLSEEGKKTFDTLEVNRTKLAEEMFRIVKVLEGLALDAEAEAHVTARELQVGTMSVPLQEVPAVDTTLAEEYLNARKGVRVLHEKILDSQDKQRLRA